MKLTNALKLVGFATTQANAPRDGMRFEQLMPRYYFHLHDDLTVSDDEGQELSGDDAARDVAIDSARALAWETLKKGYIDLSHYIRVTDDSGGEVFQLSFRDAFTITG